MQDPTRLTRFSPAFSVLRARPPQTIPSTEAASLTHSPRSHHAGIARRLAQPKAEFEVVRSDAQSKRRVKKRGPSGGKTCRIRQAGGLSASVASVASATGVATTSLPLASATESAAAQAASASSSVWTEAAVAASSAAAAPESTAWTSTWVEYETEVASSAPAPAAATSAVSSGGSAGTGGWMNSGSKVGLCWPNGDWVSGLPSRSM
jgi:hypothetical protein